MKHGKLIGLQTDIERLARVAVAAYDAATAPQTAPSGSISLDNADGTRTIIGPQAGSGDGAPSGQAMATHVGDTTPPPVPTGITAWSGDGSLHVMWDGTLSGDVPADFDHISILVDGEEVAQLSSAGSVTVGGVEAGATVSVTATAEDDACLADGTPAHNVSTPCAAVKVTVKDAVAEVRADADAHGKQIDAVRQDIAAYKDSAEATYATKTEVDERTGAITKTLAADYTRTADLAATEAVKDAMKAGTDAQGQLADYMESNDAAVADAKAAGTGASAALDSYKGVVSETYAEKTELTEAVNQLSSTMTSNYSAFTDYRETNDTAVSKAQSDATNAQSTIDSYKASNDRAVADAKKAGTDAQSQLGSYKSSNDAAVALADAMIDSWFFGSRTDTPIQPPENIPEFLTALGISWTSWVSAKRMAEKILIEQVEANTTDVNENAVQFVVDWTLSNKAYFGTNAIGTCLGMVSEQGNIAYIFPSMLNQALTKAGYSPRKTMKYMAERGLITSSTDGSGKKVYSVVRRFGDRTCRFVEFFIGKLAGTKDPIDDIDEISDSKEPDGPEQLDLMQGFTELTDGEEDLPF